MTTKSDFYKIVYDRLKQDLVSKGYKPAPKCFWRKQGELTLAVAIYKLPHSLPNELKLICEAGVHSAEFDLRLGRFPGINSHGLRM